MNSRPPKEPTLQRSDGGFCGSLEVVPLTNGTLRSWVCRNQPLHTFKPMGHFQCFRKLRGVLVVVAIASGLVGSALGATADPTANPEPVRMAAFQVTGDMLEDFGFRVSPDPRVKGLRLSSDICPVVDLVLPNTAASKAGVRPGDRIVRSDGVRTGSMSPALGSWKAIQKKKWAQKPDARGEVVWTLEMDSLLGGPVRTVVLTLPTPAPHWGATVWSRPMDRPRFTVEEPGPLAERAEEILNHGIWMILRESYVSGLRLLPADLFLCYQWTLWDARGGHRMYVTQQRGRTDIILEAIERATNSPGGLTPTKHAPDKTLASATTTLAASAMAYLTSPAGKLEAAMRLGRRDQRPLGEAEAGFNAELEFWLHRVGKTSPLWPLGVIEPPPPSKKPPPAP